MWKSPIYVVAGLLCAEDLSTGVAKDVRSVETLISCLTSTSLDILTPVSRDWNEAITPYVQLESLSSIVLSIR